MNAYKEVIGRSNQNLTNGKVIYWKNVRKLIKFLADNEYDNLMDEYKIRENGKDASLVVKQKKIKKQNICTFLLKIEKWRDILIHMKNFGKKDIMKRYLIPTNPLSLRSK